MKKILTILILAITVMCFTACSDEATEEEISVGDKAEKHMSQYDTKLKSLCSEYGFSYEKGKIDIGQDRYIEVSVEGKTKKKGSVMVFGSFNYPKDEWLDNAVNDKVN